MVIFRPFIYMKHNNENYSIHSPTNTLFIKLEKDFKLTIKLTQNLLLHVSVYDNHQGAYPVAWLKLFYVKIHYKVTSLYAMPGSSVSSLMMVVDRNM
jgi:hypothetical protein